MYTEKYLLEYTRDVFMKMGCNREDAGLIADVFLAA